MAGLQVACEAHNVHVYRRKHAPKSLVYKLYRSCTLSCILVDTLVDELLQWVYTYSTVHLHLMTVQACKLSGAVKVLGASPKHGF